MPDSLDGVQEGAVFEETLLARDEMANLAWAIEKKVQGVSGEPLDRDLEAKSLAFQQQHRISIAARQPAACLSAATPVPANWTPLLPVRDTKFNLADPLKIRLARAGMKRFYPEATSRSSAWRIPTMTAFLALLDAQDNFIERLAIGEGLRAYVFYPRGWLLRRDPLQPMLRRHAAHRGRRSAAHRRDLETQVPIRAHQRWAKLAVDRAQQDRRTGEAASALRFDVAIKRTTVR